MNSMDFDEEIPEYYVEYVSNVIFTEEAPNTIKNAELLTPDIAPRWTIKSLLDEQYSDALRRD